MAQLDLLHLWLRWCPLAPLFRLDRWLLLSLPRRWLHWFHWFRWFRWCPLLPSVLLPLLLRLVPLHRLPR